MISNPIPTTRQTSDAPAYAALILAAGYSSRMGEAKPLLRIGNVTAVEAAIQSFQAAGIANILVILGNRAEEIRPVVERAGGRCIFNPDFVEGMYSSVLAGIAALPERITACFILPADMPLVRSHTIRRMARVYARRRIGILYPVFAGRRGHPPLVSSTVLNTMLGQGRTGCLREFLQNYKEQAGEVAVHDEGIRVDIDTPSDYARVITMAACRDVPDEAECEDILARWVGKESIARHSRLVARVADRIAAGLDECNVQLNRPLIYAGAMLHDIAKGKPHHARMGARIVEALGFPLVAKVVRAHMDLTFHGAIDETAVVYLADKLVHGDRIVSLEQRFQNTLSKFSGNPSALSAALRRRDTARAVAAEIETILGVQLRELLAKFEKCYAAPELVSKPVLALSSCKDHCGARGY